MSDDPFSRLAQSVDELIFQRDQLKIEVGRLKVERDEARREVSVLRPSVCLGEQTAQEYAKYRGWDCFKQDGMTDAEFLRCLAQNDYSIDGGLLADAVRLNEIADRIEKGHR